MNNYNNPPFTNKIVKNYSNLVNEIIKTNKQKEKKKCTNFLKWLTFLILVKFTGTLVQSLVSIIAIIDYVISTYYDDLSNDPSYAIILANLSKIEIFVGISIIFFLYHTIFSIKKKNSIFIRFLKNFRYNHNHPFLHKINNFR